MNLFSIDQEIINNLGISKWGYTEELTPVSLSQYHDWVNKDQHQPLNYLADHRQNLRNNLKNFYPEVQSALVFLFDYTSQKKTLNELDVKRIASYALAFDGEDYHLQLKDRLLKIQSVLKTQLSNLECKISLDVHPVLERDLAYRAGLGWFGKNSMLINRTTGSYFLIGSLLLNQKLNLPKVSYETDHCGTCTLCIQACPTNAIDPENRTIVAQKCISTFTIEIFKDAQAPAGFEKSGGEVFGCDICQDVCPWNKKPLEKVMMDQGLEERLKPFKKLISSPIHDVYEWINKMSQSEFKNKFKSTPFLRPGKRGWLKNLKAYLENFNSN